jgi:DNA replication protein DnaC
MLTQPLLDKLAQLRLSAFRAALEEQLHNPQYADLSFEDRLGLLVDHECVLGPTGVGKTFLACALGHAACRQHFNVRYERTSRLLQQTALAHADGSYPKLLDAFARIQVLVLDDWLRDPLTRLQSQDLLEILDDRYGRSSTLVATQVPVAEWHARFPDPTIGDAILDRLVHNAYRLTLKGESRRKVEAALAMSTT